MYNFGLHFEWADSTQAVMQAHYWIHLFVVFDVPFQQHFTEFPFLSFFKCSNEPSVIQDEETRPSRRKCLVCLGAVTIISATGPTICTPNGIAADMTNKSGIQKAVCRNCNGSGAVICKGFTSLNRFACSCFMLNDFISYRLHIRFAFLKIGNRINRVPTFYNRIMETIVLLTNWNR